MKTVETRPNGSANTVYTNYVGDGLLKRLASGSDVWLRAGRFDSNAKVLQYAYPSAVAGFDLAIAYNAASGLFRLYDYYGDAAPGYVRRERLRQGTAGAPVLLNHHARRFRNHEFQLNMIAN